jgi:hypothetical protein
MTRVALHEDDTDSLASGSGPSGIALEEDLVNSVDENSSST